MSYIYCKITFNPLINIFVNTLMINNYYHSLCYFYERVGHFGFYPVENTPMNLFQVRSNIVVFNPFYQTVKTQLLGMK